MSWVQMGMLKVTLYLTEAGERCRGFACIDLLTIHRVLVDRV
jgi:hypothetical protein